jgi:aminopeptidase N
MRTDTTRPVRLAEYRPPNHLIDQVALDVRLHPTATVVEATLAIRPNPAGDRLAPLVLDRDNIVPERILLDGRPLATADFEIAEAGVILPKAPDRPFTLHTLTTINPKANTALTGLYLSNGVFCTQCEAEGFRRITPFCDRPDVLARYRTRIEAVKGEAPILLSNGNPAARGELPAGRHFAVWDDPWPKPAYLFALVGGDLAVVRDRFVTRSGRAVVLEIYVEHGKENRCAWAMESLKRCMRWDEEAFGREYDLDVFMIVAVADFNMGAMENKGLNIFNDKYVLALPDTATDTDFVQIEAIIAHEYFHNWTGNRITCRDWFQLCLKEGLTVFRDQEFTSDVRSRSVKRIADVRNLRSQQFAEDAGPLAHPVRPDTYREINNFYTATVYEKGAEVIRMLKTIIGDDAFARGMDLYFERNDGRAATVEDFLACFAEVSGRDLSQFMLWYVQAGTPEILADGAHDPAARTYTLTLHQTVPPTPGQPVKEPMVVPVALGLVGSDGPDLELTPAAGERIDRGVVVLTEARTTITFRDVPTRPVPSLLRGFSAPVRLTAQLSDADLLFLLAHDSDTFNRWQAGQSLAMRYLLPRCGGAETGSTLSASAIAEAMYRVLDDRALDDAFVAQTLALPSETDIARELQRNVDPDAVFATRQALRRDISSALGDQLRARYRALAALSPYTPDAASVGRRSLKNTILDLILAGGREDDIVLATTQFTQADNMTDRLAAVSCLALVKSAEREECLAAFYTRHRDDPLVIDKWFTVQATIPETATLDRVRRLTEHTAFSFANPNRVRALIGALASGNPTQFNRADGAGFEFVADIVLMLDATNPQVAARLLSTFRSWRALEPRRREHAEAALRRIAGRDQLSPDVRDIVQRSLS